MGANFLRSALNDIIIIQQDKFDPLKLEKKNKKKTLKQFL